MSHNSTPDSANPNARHDFDIKTNVFSFHPAHSINNNNNSETMIVVSRSSFSILSLFFFAVHGRRPAWQTLQEHLATRPNLSRTLKPNPNHFPVTTVDYGGSHPFEQATRRLEEYTAYRDDEIISYAGTSAKLRIRFLTEPLESQRNQSGEHDAAIETILNEVLPEVEALWTAHLNVVPVQGSIPIDSNVCFGAYADANLIPTSTLNSGVNDADLVVIVSGSDELLFYGESYAMCESGTLAAATSCVLDQFDRPIVGYINFCLDTIGSVRRLDEVQIQANPVPKVSLPSALFDTKFEKVQGEITDETTDDTILIAAHEVGHVLGVDSDLFVFFRDPTTGLPRTPRPFQLTEVTCVNGTDEYQYFPAESTLKSEITSDGLFSYTIVTPRVATVTRNQFDCQSLTGARLENRPGEGCTGSHFDERLFFTELMGPVFSGTSDVLSPLTLALLEDSGWYQVNYEGSQVSPYGFGAGCGFVNDACIIDDAVPSYSTGTFCTDVTTVESGEIAAGNNYLCDPSHRSINLCDLFDTDLVSSVHGIEFDEAAISYFSDQSLKTLSAHADYCPMPDIPIGIDCTIEFGDTLSPTYSGEMYGPNSRCVNFEPDPYSNRKVAGCFNVQCDASLRKVVVNGMTCDFDDQLVPVRTLSGYEVNMICPKLKVVCPEFYCQSGCSGRGTCNFGTGQCECFEPDTTSSICMPNDNNGGLGPISGGPWTMMVSYTVLMVVAVLLVM